MREIDKDIIEKAALGDMTAFEAIYEVFSSTVYSIALGVTRQRRDAEEVTQDVFVKLFRSLKNFRFSSSFGTWLYRITMNTAINFCHSRARRESAKTALGEFVGSAGAPETSLAKDMLDREDAESKIRHLLGQLSPEHRACIVLRELEGMDYKDMAGVLGIPLNTVRSRLKRAREAMIACCRKEGFCHGL